ncbi:uncharacterized protein LOC126888785 [Diabrotica virgifera virgifera]|uniref:Uncharacterized protein n=1 Tax=Diabrotica virgifera virgifera TaxID=50390 RepID=A0ABM5KSF2_DIAVI|nr:uncharacterized protein LOC126888785 [Diabrotica virgifera virgifera]
MRMVYFASILLLFNMANGLPQQDEHLHLYEPARLLDGHRKPYNVKTKKVTKSGVTLRSNFFETMETYLNFMNYGAAIYTKSWRTTQPPMTPPTPRRVTDSDKAFAFHVLNVPVNLDWRSVLNPTIPTTPTTTTTTTPAVNYQPDTREFIADYDDV